MTRFFRNIKIEDVDIPIDANDISLKGSIYFSSKTQQKAPWIINLSGVPEDRESFFVKYYSDKFARAGFYVLSYDYRGLGETAKKTGRRWDKMLPKTFSDLPKIIDWIIENQIKRLSDDKIALFGRSMGGAIILTNGFIDKRAKILIPLTTRYDYGAYQLRFPENTIQKISPKFFLKKDPLNNERILTAHCKDDKRISFESFIKIKEHLG